MKSIGIGFTTFVIGMMAAYCTMTYSTCQDKKQSVKDATSQANKIIELQIVPVNHWIDANGTDHATKEEATATSEAAMLEIKKEMTEMAYKLKVKPKQIVQFQQIGMVDTGMIQAAYDVKIRQKYISTPSGNIIDTVERSFEWVDDYAWVKGLVGKKIVQIKYELDDSLTIVGYTKRKWLLGKDHLYTDASLMNPNAYVRGMNGIEIKGVMPGRISVGPYIGFDVTHMNVGFGISVQYAIWRF